MQQRRAQAAAAVFGEHARAGNEVARGVLGRIQRGGGDDAHSVCDDEAGDCAMEKAGGDLRLDERAHVVEGIAPSGIETESGEDDVADDFLFVAGSGTDVEMRRELRLKVGEFFKVPSKSLPADELHVGGK